MHEGILRRSLFGYDVLLSNFPRFGPSTYLQRLGRGLPLGKGLERLASRFGFQTFEADRAIGITKLVSSWVLKFFDFPAVYPEEGRPE